MLNFLRLLSLVFAATVIAGCGATAPVKSGNPEILGSVSVKGKGVPNGRSDSKARFAKLDGVSTDPGYGYSKANPINVGVGDIRHGPASERFYLNALRSSKGLPIEYERIGSCCVFKTPKSPQGHGLLDVFKITTPDSNQPKTLFLNFYDDIKRPVLAPIGFTPRKIDKQMI